MRTIEDVRAQFGYHPATADTAPKHAAVRDLIGETAERLWVLLPDGPEKTLALRSLQESQMYANLAIALTAPVDDGETRATARVLPAETPLLDCINAELAGRFDDELAAEAKRAVGDGPGLFQGLLNTKYVSDRDSNDAGVECVEGNLVELSCSMYEPEDAGVTTHLQFRPAAARELAAALVAKATEAEA